MAWLSQKGACSCPRGLWILSVPTVIGKSTACLELLMLNWLTQGLLLCERVC